ncbi:MAG: hypothetical protein APR54_09045 [Candidatus Cloacimonas sp. SDB]|nr:MAG: hypothetical protein APR54_09045 [Candidatus Cloacimonas sp. SDB]
MLIFNSCNDLKLKEFLQKNHNFTFLHFTGKMLGIGAPYNSIKSINKINQLKKRKSSKGYIILMPQKKWLQDFGLEVNKTQRRLIQQYWPGDLTILFKDGENRFQPVSLDKKVAVRVPTNFQLRKFIEIIGIPIISTSINESGQNPVTDIAEIESGFNNWFDFMLLPKELQTTGTESSSIVDCTDNEINVLREGMISRDDLLTAIKNPLILFICTGNICRSPLAEFYARTLIKQQNLPFRTKSAGFLGTGHKISQNSEILLNEININAQNHRSTMLNEEVLDNSWLILTMEERHKLEILKYKPEAENKVFTLSEYCGKNYCENSNDISDPYGSDLASYKKTFDLIKIRVECLIKKISQEV